jgi:hypothetical protein
MEDKSAKIIDNIIREKGPLQNVTAAFLQLKDIGISQTDVIDYLESYRRNEPISEETDDWILEILDIATGFCNQKYRVW